MDPELKTELERLGVLPEGMYKVPEGTEVHRSPRHLPPYISKRLDRIEANASTMHRLETEGKAGSAEYAGLEREVRRDLSELKPYTQNNAWIFPQRMIDEGEAYDPQKHMTGVAGVFRDIM